MFPATRMTNRSPTPWSNTISAGTRESEHPRTIAKGSCCFASSARREWLRSLARSPLLDAKRRLPSRRRSRASGAEIIATSSLSAELLFGRTAEYSRRSGHVGLSAGPAP